VLLRNFPFVVREVRLTVFTRFSERAVRSLRTIGRVGLALVKVDATSLRSLVLLYGEYGRFKSHLGLYFYIVRDRGRSKLRRAIGSRLICLMDCILKIDPYFDVCVRNFQ